MDLEFKKENLEDAKIKFSVTIAQKRIKNEFNQVCLDLSKDYVLPGFRKGKAPLIILKKKLGPTIRYEVLKKMVSEVIEDILKKEKIQSIGDPKIEDLSSLIENLSENKELAFSFEIECYPVLGKLASYEGLDILINSKKRESKQEDFDQLMQKLRENQARVEIKSSNNQIEKGDIVQVEYYFSYLKNDQEIKEDPQIYNLDLASKKEHFLMPFKKDLIGLKRLDQKTFFADLDSLRGYFPANFFSEMKSKQKIQIHLKVVDILCSTLPPIDDELAKDYHCDNLEELNQQIWNKIHADIEEENQNKVWTSIINRLITDSEFSIGEQFIESQVKFHLNYLDREIRAMNISLNDYLAGLNQSYEDYISRLKSEVIFNIKYQLIYDQLLTQLSIQIDPESIEQEIKKYLSTMIGLPRKQEEMIKNLKKNREEIRKIEDKLKMRKILFLLMEKNNITYS